MCQKRYISKENGVEGSPLLLKFFLDVPDNIIRKKFRENLFFGEPQIMKEKVTKLINDRNFNIYNTQKNIKSIKYYRKYASGRLKGVEMPPVLLFE